MAKKKIHVKDILPLIEGKVSVISYAYGIFYAHSEKDCETNSEFLMEHLKYEILEALVIGIEIEKGEEPQMIIKCEICK